MIAIGGGAMAAGFLMTPRAVLVAESWSRPSCCGSASSCRAHEAGPAPWSWSSLRGVPAARRVGQLKRIIIGHPELFDRYLPFAMAFGVERRWARAFEGIYTQPPTWYVGPSMAHFT